VEFSAPRKALRWAHDEIDNFQKGMRAFFDEHSSNKFNEFNALDGFVIYGILIPKNPSDDLQRSAYRIVTDLRNALDYTTHAASAALRERAKPGRKTKNAYFPFGESGKDFAIALSSSKGRYRDIPVELHPTITAFKPYWASADDPEGDSLLRALPLLANPNKHEVPLDVDIGLGAGIRTMMGVAQMGGRWHGDNKLELYRVLPGQQFRVEMDLAYSLAVPKTKGLASRNAIDVFDELHGKIGRIVSALETETARLLS
jgi:hypothetical protein